MPYDKHTKGDIHLPLAAEWDPVAADEAAEAFEKELKKLPALQYAHVAELWRRYYMKAGHKRLARKLLELTKPKMESKVK